MRGLLGKLRAAGRDPASTTTCWITEGCRDRGGSNRLPTAATRCTVPRGAGAHETWRRMSNSTLTLSGRA